VSASEEDKDASIQTLAEEELPKLDDELDDLTILEQEVIDIQEGLEVIKVDKSETNLKLADQEAQIDSLLEQNNALTNQLSELFDDGSQDKMGEKLEAADSPAADKGFDVQPVQLAVKRAETDTEAQTTRPPRLRPYRPRRPYWERFWAFRRPVNGTRRFPYRTHVPRQRTTTPNNGE